MAMFVARNSPTIRSILFMPVFLLVTILSRKRTKAAERKKKKVAVLMTSANRTKEAL